ncbi:MAG: methyl-accepting chemotaxis protein [Spirochaetota bacterium]
MTTLRISFQKKIIMILITAFVVMSAGILVITYNILYASMLDRYYTQGDFLAEYAARTISKDRFKVLAESLDDTHSHFNDIRTFLFRIKSSNDVDNFYTATLSVEADALVYVVDGNERYDESFTPPGTTLEEAGSRDRPEALEAYQYGRSTQTPPYRTESGERFLSVYYPIFDGQNNVLGIVGCDFDFRRIMNSVFKDLLLIMATIVLFAFLTIVSIIVFFKINLISPVMTIKEFLEKLAFGDLSLALPDRLAARPDEIGTIVRALEHARESFRDIIRSIHDENMELQHVIRQTTDEIDSLHSGIDEIDRTSQQISAGMEETAASSEQMDATAHQIVDTIQSITRKAEEGTTVAGEILKRADVLRNKAMESRQSGRNITEEVNAKLKDAIAQSKSVNEINTLADSILNITEQTNLLALNAAIEAARAGESGKGFTVVADEIMKLATESQETASRIIDVTKIVLSSVSNLTQSSQQVLDYISDYVEKDYEGMVTTGRQYSDDAKVIEDITGDFKERSELLLVSIKDTIKAIEEISRSAQEGSTETAQIASNTNILNERADTVLEMSRNVNRTLSVLNERLAVFKL